MNNEEYETKEENDVDKIPKHRAFNLYVILICGLIISLTGIYTKVFSLDKKASLYYDGDGFKFGAIDGIYYIVTGIIICIFPAWHLYKGNHKRARVIRVYNLHKLVPELYNYSYTSIIIFYSLI